MCDRLSLTAKLIPLNKYIKKKATLSVARRLDEVIDEPLMYDLIEAAIEEKSPNENIWDAIKRIDLVRIMKDSPGLNKRFTCSFHADRQAWIYRNKQGFYRYYSRKKSGIYSFDLIDLLGIFRNETEKDVLNFIQSRWGIEGLSEWYLKQKKKYETNEWILQNIKQNPDEFPSLHKMIKKHWGVLEKLNEFAMEKLVGKELSSEKDAIFFFSNNYFLEQYFPHYSISTINNLINLFCILGFLQKVPFDKIPISLAKDADKYHKLKKVRNHVSYYKMAHFKDVYIEAENRAIQLINADVYYHRITKRKVIELFGESFASEIYVQAIGGNRAKQEPIYVKGQNNFYTETEKLEKLFLNELQRTGKCAKSTLFESSLLPRRRFHMVWNRLLEKYHCQEKYPTKKEFQQYQIDKRLLIAVPFETPSIVPLTIGNINSTIEKENSKRRKKCVS